MFEDSDDDVDEVYNLLRSKSTPEKGQVINLSHSRLPQLDRSDCVCSHITNDTTETLKC